MYHRKLQASFENPLQYKSVIKVAIRQLGRSM